jgi:hypothetical protein
MFSKWTDATGTIIGFKEEWHSSWHPKNAIRTYALVELDSGHRIKILPDRKDSDFLAVGDRIRFKYVSGKEDKVVQNLERL